MGMISRRGLVAASAMVPLMGCAKAGKAPVYKGKVTFDHGVASGDPLSDRVVIWTRVTPEAHDMAQNTPVAVEWVVASDAALTLKVQSGFVVTNAARDYTVKVDVVGLQPGEHYYYGFNVGKTASAIGRAVTAPVGEIDSVTVALVSCSNYQFGYFNAYRALAQLEDLDLVLHLGDYIYEHGPDGYGSEPAKALGRQHLPAREIITLADYRERYAQYRTDPDLQIAHARASWIVTWDDHEFTNDAWMEGAQNHNPEMGEGDWVLRRNNAVQAYLEWMPVRDPAADKARFALYRSVDWGDLLTFIALETRLTGRSEQLNYERALQTKGGKGIDLSKLPALLAQINNPARQMLGTTQEKWLGGELNRSTSTGVSWQFLVNQTIMAPVKMPNIATAVPKSVAAKVAKLGGFFENMATLGSQNVPMNLDAWDGYPAARARVLEMAKDAEACLLVATGDTHAAWANEILANDGQTRLGVEFGTTSVTSSSLGDRLAETGLDLGKVLPAQNPDVVWHSPVGRGYTLLTISHERVQADFIETAPPVERIDGVRILQSLEVTRKEPVGTGALVKLEL